MANEITELREKVRLALEPLQPGEVSVQLGPTETKEQNVVLKALITVGTPGPEAEERLDELFIEVRETIDQMVDLPSSVKGCSGYRMYANGPEDQAPKLGAEWTITVLM